MLLNKQKIVVFLFALDTEHKGLPSDCGCVLDITCSLMYNSISV